MTLLKVLSDLDFIRGFVGCRFVVRGRAKDVLEGKSTSIHSYSIVVENDKFELLKTVTRNETEWFEKPTISFELDNGLVCYINPESLYPLKENTAFIHNREILK